MAVERISLEKQVIDSAPPKIKPMSYGNTGFMATENISPHVDSRLQTGDDTPAPPPSGNRNKGVGNKDPFAILPPVVRPGTNNIESMLYKNRPIIEIIDRENEDNQGSAKYHYDQWILMSVQEQDAEKIDVIETFGDPHLFASGRFMRRYTFQGMLRTTPINALTVGPDGSQPPIDPNSLTGKILRVPQTVLFRNFYNKYMRISEQALQKTFTRITVDKEVYEGYVTTFNVSRESSIETFSPFVFTLVAFNRRHIDLDSAADDIIKSTRPVKVAPVPRTAAAERSDANPPGGMSVMPARANIGRQAIDTTDTPLSDKQVIQLFSTSNKEQIFVSTSLPGIEPIYAHSFQGAHRLSAIPLHGSLMPQESPIDISYRITNYWALYNALLNQHNNGQTFVSTVDQGRDQSQPLSSLPGNVLITLHTASGQEAQFVLEFTLEPPTSIQVAKVQGLVGGLKLSKDPIVIPSTAHGGQIHLGEARFNASWDINNRASLDIRYFIAAPDGQDIPPPTIQGAVVDYDVKRVYPGFGTSLARVDTKSDTDICNGTVIDIAGSTVPLPDNKSFQQSINITPLSPNKLLSTGNPFKDADHFVLELHPIVRLAGFKAITDLPNLLISIYQGPSALRESLQNLSFIGAEWNPSRSTARDGTNTVTRLDRFGYVSFLITTKDGEDVASLVKDALRDSSLIYQSRYMRFSGFSFSSGASAVIDKIPLSGKGYGTGQAIDGDTKETIAIRTRQVGMDFRKDKGGLVLKIELSATHTTGVAANLYSDRFWQYLTDVQNASVNIPKSAGVLTPSPWEHP